MRAIWIKSALRPEGPGLIGTALSGLPRRSVCEGGSRMQGGVGPVADASQSRGPDSVIDFAPDYAATGA